MDHSAQGRFRLGRDLTVIIVIVAVMLGAVGVGITTLYRQLYSPTAFVQSYLSLLGAGRAADALAVPGVSVETSALTDAGLTPSASEALLRPAALAQLTDVRPVSEVADGGITKVTVSYRAGGSYRGTTTFAVERNGWIGVVPVWRFARSPLALLDLTVRGSMRFSVNGFEVDKRQVAAEGAEVDPLAPVPMLVFSPGVYRVSVDTAISTTPGVDVLADKPLADVPVDLQATPTTTFIAVVQERVDGFLAQCATQKVLQPTGCPFGFVVNDRIQGLPQWSIVDSPAINVVPDGAHWRIPGASAVARIQVDVVSLYDGSVTHVDEEVRFVVTGDITILPDGTASIQVGGPP